VLTANLALHMQWFAKAFPELLERMAFVAGDFF
jgi:hypothetical protein